MSSRKKFRLRGDLRLKNARLVETREELGMTQKAFAEHVGIQHGQYNGYETLRLYPTRKHRKLLAEICGLDEGELFPPELKEYAKKKESRLLVSTAVVEPSRLLGMNRREVRALPAPADIEKELSSKELKGDIEWLLSTLKEREAKIIRLSFGLGDQESMTQEEIGSLLGISSERVRQIREKALERLRYRDRAKILKPFLLEVEGVILKEVMLAAPPEQIEDAPDSDTAAGIKEYRARIAALTDKESVQH